MPSPLFNFASRQLQKVALSRFRATPLGKIMSEMQSLSSRGRLSSNDTARFARQIRGMTSRSVAETLLKEIGAGAIVHEAEKYGRASDFLTSALGALGPVGDLIKSLSNPFRSGGRRVGAAREIAAAASLLKAFGHTVIPPPWDAGSSEIEQNQVADALRGLGWRVQPPGQKSLEERKPASNRKTEDIDTGVFRPKSSGGGSFTTRKGKDDPLLTGEMIPVQSSNVHSIGFRLDEGVRNRTGTLLIRFLGTDASGHRSGPGPMYEYSDVPAELFERFRKASSKGKFVWDDIRVRGTVSGHQFPYKLADIVNGYVPRQAGLKRGHIGEYYMERKFRKDGKLHTSQLPERRVRGSGEALQGPGVERLNLIPNRGRPNSPNRGTPNRGR